MNRTFDENGPLDSQELSRELEELLKIDGNSARLFGEKVRGVENELVGMFCASGVFAAISMANAKGKRKPLSGSIFGVEITTSDYREQLLTTFRANDQEIRFVSMTPQKGVYLQTCAKGFTGTKAAMLDMINNVRLGIETNFWDASRFLKPSEQ